MLSSRLSPLYAAILLLTALPYCARADATADARKAIQTLYDRESAAAEKKDAKGTTGQITPDYIGIGKGGSRSDAAQLRQDVQMLLSMFKTLKVSQTVQSLTLKGNQAVVTMKAHIVGLIGDPSSQKTHQMVVDSVSEDTWVRSGARGWLLRRSKTISERSLADGKPLPGK
jgi:ketosteroid isomerase-like protein